MGGLSLIDPPSLLTLRIVHYDAPLAPLYVDHEGNNRDGQGRNH